VPDQLDADESSNASVDSAESEAELGPYELQREINIARNAAFLASVGLGRDCGPPAPSKERVRPAASEPALVRRTQRPRQCKRVPPVAAAAAASDDAVERMQRRPAAAAASEVDAAVRMRRQAAAAAASEDHAAGRMRPRPGPRPKDGTISTECRKDGCPWGAVRGKEGRLLGHGLCRNCAAEARAVAKAERSKRKAEGDAAGEGAEAAVRRQPSDNAKGKARRVVRDDEEEDADDAFDEVYKCRTDGCRLQATRFKSGLPTRHGMCRVHGPYREQVRCSVPLCNSMAQVSGRCRLHPMAPR
jgi:hypothetical protein